MVLLGGARNTKELGCRKSLTGDSVKFLLNQINELFNLKTTSIHVTDSGPQTWQIAVIEPNWQEIRP